MRAGPVVALASLLTLAGLPVMSQGLGAGGPQVVVLLHHPYDKVDRFGIPYLDGDTFSARHEAISLDGRFDFPTFVADGVLAVSAIPDPLQPYVSTLANYTSRIESRMALGSPGTLALHGAPEGNVLAVTTRFSPAEPLVDAQHPDALHILVAVVEDFIHYQPDARVSNGVTEHRFTVRALADTGPIGADPAANRTHAFDIQPDWSRGNLIVAAWVEAQVPFGRFEAGEVLQSAWAPADGTEVIQATKAVLVEVYSATWCDPCLYGDMAAERLAVDYGGAPEAAKPVGPKYFRTPDQPILVVAVALAAAAAIAWDWRKRRA